IDHAGVHDLVRPNAYQSGRFDGRLNHILVRHIEIESATRFEVCLLTKTHHNKAGFLVFFRHGDFLKLRLKNRIGDSYSLAPTSLITYSRLPYEATVLGLLQVNLRYEFFP